MAKKKLNKKNLIAFANNLYHDDGKNIEYMPLCHGTLAKANGEILHCALGELYEEFVGQVARRAKAGDEDKENFDHKYGVVFTIPGSKGDYEFGAIRLLAQNASINKDSEEDLHDCLNDIPEVNDQYEGMSETALIKRAKAVKEKLIEIANECLV